MSKEAVANKMRDRRSLSAPAPAAAGAVAREIGATGDLSSVTVAGLTDCAGLTRRTFCSHYKDIPDFIEQVEASIWTGGRRVPRHLRLHAG